MSIAIVFPGQGSQSVGMLGEFAAAGTFVPSVFQEASDVLGYDLWKVVREGPEATLNQTEITQPALLVSGYACWKQWEAAGGEMPALFAGHSLGEYTALVCAGVIEFADAVRLVAERGRLMQEAVPAGTGSMAAVLGLDDEEIRSLCAGAAGEQVVSAANYNAPGQVVISGHAEAVQRAVEGARQAGAKRAMVLPVSVPSHCELMREAAVRLEQYMEAVPMQNARIPVLQNVDCEARVECETIKSTLLEQLYRPVQWRQSIGRMADMGITGVIECGPGRVLAGLNRRINRKLDARAVYDPASLEAALEEANT